MDTRSFFDQDRRFWILAFLPFLINQLLSTGKIIFSVRIMVHKTPGIINGDDDFLGACRSRKEA